MKRGKKSPFKINFNTFCWPLVFVVPILSFKVQVSFCNLLFHYSAHLKRAGFLYLAFRPRPTKNKQIEQVNKNWKQNPEDILCTTMGLKNKRKHFYCNITATFWYIFELHPSLEIKNVCVRNLKLKDSKTFWLSYQLDKEQK